MNFSLESEKEHSLTMKIAIFAGGRGSRLAVETDATSKAMAPIGDDTHFESQILARLAMDRELMAYRHESFWQCMDTLKEAQG
ncbi:MAG: hypothetical protein ACR2RA_07065 [Geminicoccaceae bacterium]